MSKVDSKFIDLCLAGEALADDIFNYIGEWHESDTDESLAEFLGFTQKEYELWVEKPRLLEVIIHARDSGRSLQEMQDVERAHLIAARGLPPEEAEVLQAWLRRTGRN